MIFEVIFLRRLPLSLCLIIFFLGAGGLTHAKELEKNPTSIRYEPAQVELEGMFTTRLEYGPPGFGEAPETDKRVKIFLLILSHPVNVAGDPNNKDHINTESFFGLKEIQMVIFRDKKEAYKKFIGKKVRVTGTLFASHTGNHYTKVLIAVERMKSLN